MVKKSSKFFERNGYSCYDGKAVSAAAKAANAAKAAEKNQAKKS